MRRAELLSLVTLLLAVASPALALTPPKPVAVPLGSAVHIAKPKAAPSAAAATLIASASAADGEFGLNDDGALRHLIAVTPGALKAPLQGRPMAERARAFVLDQREAFGLPVAADVALERETPGTGRAYYKFRETLNGVPIMGAETVVQIDDAGGVEGVHATLARRSLVGTFVADPSAAMAVSRAERIAVADVNGRMPTSGATSRGGELTVFVPALYEMTGPPSLVWAVTMTGVTAESHEMVLVDARTGEVPWRLPLHYEALNRVIQDAANGASRPFTTVRTEGQGPAALAEANTIYDDLGAVWTFYWNQFARDSYDNAGGQLRGVARYCGFGLSGTGCNNAQFTTSDTMYVGPGFAADDVIGHEVTHGVTGHTSALAYANASGAINESMSDVFGEFVDLTDGIGNDAPSVKWLMGEDMTGGALRSMKDPHASPSGSQPDRLGDSLYVAPVAAPKDSNDFGGVHTNSGVGNKLCYLLTDGDTFNGQTVSGNGIGATASLYYETNAHLLTSSSGWTDLYYALRQAAINIGWDVKHQNNLVHACMAVEIATPNNIWADAATSCAETGAPACFIGTGPARTLGTAYAIAKPGDNINLWPRTFHESLPMTLDKILTIQASGGTATIGP